MLHCRSTSHLRRTRLPLLPLLQLRVRELDPWRKTSTPRPLPRVPCHRRLPCPQPSSNSGRDAVTPRPTKASDGRLPSMRITPGRQVAAVLRCTGSGLPSAGCQRSVTTRFPGQEPSIASTSFDRVHLHSAPRTERHAGQDDELLETDGAAYGDPRADTVCRVEATKRTTDSVRLGAVAVNAGQSPTAKQRPLCAQVGGDPVSANPDPVSALVCRVLRTRLASCDLHVGGLARFRS